MMPLSKSNYICFYDTLEDLNEKHGTLGKVMGEILTFLYILFACQLVYNTYTQLKQQSPMRFHITIFYVFLLISVVLRILLFNDWYMDVFTCLDASVRTSVTMEMIFMNMPVMSLILAAWVQSFVQGEILASSNSLDEGGLRHLVLRCMLIGVILINLSLFFWLCAADSDWKKSNPEKQLDEYVFQSSLYVQNPDYISLFLAIPLVIIIMVTFEFLRQMKKQVNYVVYKSERSKILGAIGIYVLSLGTRIIYNLTFIDYHLTLTHPPTILLFFYFELLPMIGLTSSYSQQQQIFEDRIRSQNTTLLGYEDDPQKSDIDYYGENMLDSTF